MAFDVIMEDQILLGESTFCRLCAEENENGIYLFEEDENGLDLSTTVNKYLPIKIQDDGKYPRTICPGCNIQLDAMVQFLELIICGQERIRALWRKQQETYKFKEKAAKLLEQPNIFETTTEIGPFTIPAIEGGGKEIFIQIMPDGTLYAPEHEMSLKIEGLEKPKRKRGRPPKPPPGNEPSKEEIRKEEDVAIAEEDMEDDVDGDGRKRRRRKVPFRFREAVQGKELERIFREEGVIDEEEGSEEDEVSDEKGPIIIDNAGDEIIGHLENQEGQDLGEVIVVNKGKPRLKQKNRRRKKFTCEICGKGFMHYGRFMVHKSYHKGVKYECKMCSDIFGVKEDLIEHQSITNHTGEGIIETLVPEVVDVSPENIVGHQKIDPISPEHKYPCDQCEKSFMSKQSYEVHVKAKHEGQKPFQCDKCDKTFAYHASLKGHLSSHEIRTERGYTCDLCEKVFNHPSSVVYHKEAEHNNGRRFVCNKCGKSFKHKQLLQRHQLVHTEDRPYECKACGASFKTRANLLNHQPTHTGVKKYFCQQCGQLFAHKTSLTLHYRWHSGQKPYECTICKKSFSQKGNLREHKRIHTGEKPYACDFCGRRFTTSSQYKLHVKRHTGEKPWSCEYCSKTFLHKDTWKSHLRRHKNERPFQCSMCLRDFTEQWALKKHMRLHTGEKPYVCSVCNKAFADCSNLTKHKRVHRNNKPAAPTFEGQLTLALDTPVDNPDTNVIYMTYPDPTDSTEMPTLVQILDDASSTIGNVTSLSQTEDENLDSTLMTSSEEHNELRLEDFGADNSSLPLTNTPLHVTDEEGNPIYYTTQEGQQIRVTSFDGQNLQVCMDDGSIVPIQLNAENGKPVAVELSGENSDVGKEKEIMDDSIYIAQLSGEKPDIPLDTEVTSLMDQTVQFMTEDGQNVGLVTIYNVDSDITANYLGIS